MWHIVVQIYLKYIPLNLVFMNPIRRILKLPLYIKILIGMVLGILFGIIFVSAGWDFKIAEDWIIPFGDIFMHLLKLIAVPLVFTSLITGIGGVGDITSLSKLGWKTLITYIATTILAISIGVILVLTIRPGEVINQATQERLSSAYSSTVEINSQNALGAEDQSPLQFLVDMIPENVFQAFSNNGDMLQVICFAILIGIAVLLISKKSAEPFMNIMNSFNTILLKIIDLIMGFAPIGVFSLMCSMVISNSGDSSLFGALGLYALTVILGLLTMIIVVYPLLIKLFKKDSSTKQFFKAIWPVQLLAFSTSSSAATLPLTIKQAHKAGVSKRTANFVLPVGVTINMDGTSLYQAVASIFIAQVFGMDLTFLQIITIIATTTISSIGTPGIPGGSVVILVMVLSSVGIPAEGLALILGIDRPIDMLRTVANVTGDVSVAAIVDSSTSNNEQDNK